MNLDEINNLISVRNYIYNSINNSSIDRVTVSELNGMLILTDKKIIDLLRGDEFKDYINYKDVKKAIYDVAMMTNIKSSLKK